MRACALWRWTRYKQTATLTSFSSESVTNIKKRRKKTVQVQLWYWLIKQTFYNSFFLFEKEIVWRFLRHKKSPTEKNLVKAFAICQNIKFEFDNRLDYYCWNCRFNDTDMKNLCSTEFSTKIYWSTRLAASYIFHMFAQSIKFF